MKKRLTIIAVLLFTALAVLSFFIIQPARANFDAAYKEIKSKNYAAAFPIMKEAAKAGEVRAQCGLGLMLMLGKGVRQNTAESVIWLEKAANSGSSIAMNALASAYLDDAHIKQDIDKARRWATRSAATGDMKGQYLVFDSISLRPQLSYYGTNAQTKEQKYQILDRLPVSDRKAEIEAYTMLSLSVEQGYLPAKQRALSLLPNYTAPKNRTTFLTLAQDAEEISPKLKKDIQDTMALQKLGESYTALAFFRDMEPAINQNIQLNVSRINKSCEKSAFKLIKTHISSPIDQAAYLPIHATLLKDMYLIGGAWQETWTYDGCGKQWAFLIAFTANKLGCVHYESKELAPIPVGLPDI